MKEKLIDIVQTLDSCAKAIRGKDFSLVARVHCQYDGKPESFWFTSSSVRQRDLKDVKKYGIFVPKNSNVAIKMQTLEVGKSFDYELTTRIKRIQYHHVELENRSDFQNQTIVIAGDNLLYQYRSISEFLSALQQNKEEIADTENKIADLRKLIEDLKKQTDTATQRGQITKSINEHLKEYRILTQQQEDLKNITIYIRKQGEMRYSLIVDPIQTRIKSQNLFDGETVIINGGPGTGKSTTMIHRLAYLTDTFAIDEDEKNKYNKYKLNSEQRRLLREAIKAQRDWMFFSPSPMLRKYLAEAMKKEGLSNTYQKVWDWKGYCRKILQTNYELMGDDDSKAPFRICYLTGTLYFQGYDIINEFTNFYLSELRAINSNLPKLKTEGTVYAWTAIAKNIEQKFEDSENFELGRFVSLFNSLESVYGNDCKDLLRYKNESITNLAEKICSLFSQNKEAKSNIEDLLDITLEESEDLSEELYIEEAEDSKEDKQRKNNDNQNGSKSELQKTVEYWLKTYCYSKVNDSPQLSDLHILISEILLPVLGDKYDSSIQKIGELMVFEQYAKYTKGVKSILLNGIPARYKKFRSHLIKNQYKGCDLKLLRDIMQRKQGKELHHQEQSLLLGFINTLVKQIKATTRANIKHDFIEAYDEVSRPIIGIDEATDFSVCEIYAMQSLLSREFYSLTLCGDMMQRLTTYGIKSWAELDSIVPNPMVVEIKTSYRQSKKLLEVARRMYTDTLGEPPSYRVFMKSSKVPDPLVFIDENELSKITWIGKRIAEVYRAYGEQLPSIAIFVNDKGYIPRFIDYLQKTDFFAENKIKVLDGKDDNNFQTTENHICVYPINLVKGMEFDVVFFHDIDNSSVDTEILKRYIYVGVSRAAFFLGVTLSEENKEITKYFEKNKDWFKI